VLADSAASNPGARNLLAGRTSCSGANDAGLRVPEEPITLYKLELDRLQYILQFPEEVAFQLSNVEYELFYSVDPIEYVRYVACDLACSRSLLENPSNVKILVKRFAEVSLASFQEPLKVLKSICYFLALFVWMHDAVLL